jgi:hypothetical protein
MNRCLPLASLLAASLAFATPPESDAPVAATTKAVVQKVLLEPLAAAERKRSRFSRSRLPAQARRVRVLDAEPRKDTEGKAFVSFAVDARHGWVDDEDELTAKAWRKDTITGCSYADTGEIFVKRGDGYFASDILLGKKTKATKRPVCVGEAAVVASKQ